MSGRDTFTNPAVLKAEVELRQALNMYETELITYKLYNSLYNSKVAKLTDITESLNNLVILQKNYESKLEAYKSLMGV
jgi:hypothetical protein